RRHGAVVLEALEVSIPESNRKKAGTSIRCPRYNICQGAQILPALDIETLNLVKDVGLPQSSYIGLNGVDRGLPLAALVQQFFLHQGVAEGCDGGSVADIVGQEHDVCP